MVRREIEPNAGAIRVDNDAASLKRERFVVHVLLDVAIRVDNDAASLKHCCLCDLRLRCSTIRVDNGAASLKPTVARGEKGR